MLQLEARHQDDKNRYHQLLEQFRLAQHNRFGKSSESQPAQLDLFNEVKEEVVTDSADNEQTISYTRKKPTRQRLPDDLPRTVIIHDIEDKTCDCCGHELHEMGRISARSWSLFQQRLKSPNIFVRNMLAVIVTRKASPQS
ncbi:hypothetical protein [Photobacterium carnosum]|uniref:IS66 family transposase n=1 Tax=Photobacterium carnosum TaxID=2023717 RepID=UPI0039F720C1